MLSIKNLHVSVDDKAILKGITLDIAPGSVHALMGPNGSGKSSLSYTLMGHPRYQITQGSVFLAGNDIGALTTDKRAKAGIFLAMQQPLEIEGVKLRDFLRQAYNALYDGTPRQLRLKEFADHLKKQMQLLGIDLSFVERSINVGFSGGEKKRAEMLQMATLQPAVVILDEIDSGLDIDALKTVCAAINAIKAQNPSMSVLLITHYTRILSYITADRVHILGDGRIVRSDGPELAQELERTGYASIT